MCQTAKVAEYKDRVEVDGGQPAKDDGMLPFPCATPSPVDIQVPFQCIYRFNSLNL